MSLYAGGQHCLEEHHSASGSHELEAPGKQAMRVPAKRAYESQYACGQVSHVHPFSLFKTIKEISYDKTTSHHSFLFEPSLSCSALGIVSVCYALNHDNESCLPIMLRKMEGGQQSQPCNDA
jgi:hypothetical protein